MAEDKDRDVVFSQSGEVYHWADENGHPICNIGDFGHGNSEPITASESEVERMVRCERCDYFDLEYRKIGEVVNSIRTKIGFEERDSPALSKEEYLVVERELAGVDNE